MILKKNWEMRLLDLYHIALLVIVLVNGMILIPGFIKSKVDEIDVHLNGSLGVRLEPTSTVAKFKLVLPRKKGWKRINIDDLFSALESIRGNQFTLALNLTGYKITVVIDLCDNGVPSYIGRPSML